MNKWLKTLNKYSFIFFLLVLYQGLHLSNFFNSAFLPSPIEVLNIFTDLDFLKLLLLDLYTTAELLFVGFISGYLIVNLISFIFNLIPQGLNQLKRLHLILKYTPLPVLIPISILFFGLGKVSIVFLTIMGVVIFFGQHQFNIIEDELKSRKSTVDSWKSSKIDRWLYFIFKPSNIFINKISTQLVLWLVGVVIFAEILNGGTNGLGVRVLEFQQLYKADALFAYVLVIILLSVIFENIINLSLSWKGFSKLRTGVLSVISVLLAVLIVYNSSLIFSRSDERKELLTYRAGINLPLFVYKEKYNDLDINLSFETSGISIMDSIVAGQERVGGFVEYPNAISGISKNSDIKIITQVVEKNNNPNLFLLSNEDIEENDWSNLDNSTIAYYPNNSIVKQGVQFTLSEQGVDTTTIDLVSSSNPSNLNQSFVSGKTSAIVTIEPFITDLEEESSKTRFNKESLITIINYENLPLAGLVLDTDEFSDDEIKTFEEGLNKSLDFIEENSKGGEISQELKEILTKYGLPETMSISNWQMYDSISISDAKNMLNFVRLLGGKNSGADKPIEEYYLD